ncbi:SRPBCC family protein [Bosea vestrisii]|uniref:SRPBCC family protein n=1 Tax=Bosea vestrisii TaxID=151416 RepID=UPI0024DFEF1B|nr:SRPBCC family protein [Bosea vestrisii]WID94458.1 SRPBCC family protein [Bosea vestrisii]
MPAETRTDTASRLIKASPGAIYNAFVDPATLGRWLPPQGMRAKIERFEPHPGGSYRMVLTYDDPAGAPGKASADSDIVEGRFVALVPGERIVWEVGFVSDDPAFAGTMTMSWRFKEVRDGTEVTILCENVPAGNGKEDHDAGLRSTLENLARFIETA